MRDSCCPLKTTCFIIAVIDMIFAALIFIAELFVGQHSITLVTTILILCGLKFYLGLLLQRGSVQEDLGKCQKWVNITGILVVIGIVGIIGHTTVNDKEIVYIVSYFIGLIYHAFSAWIVCGFIDELKQVINTKRNAARNRKS